MAVQLPLERLAAGGEDLYLPRDQRVELGSIQPGEVAVADEAATAQTEHPYEGPVDLGPRSGRQGLGSAPPELPVEIFEHRRITHHSRGVVNRHPGVTTRPSAQRSFVF